MINVHVKKSLCNIKPAFEINIKAQLIIHTVTLNNEAFIVSFVRNAKSDKAEYNVIMQPKIILKIIFSPYYILSLIPFVTAY